LHSEAEAAFRLGLRTVMSTLAVFLVLGGGAAYAA
jgi:hypothetical protein